MRSGVAWLESMGETAEEALANAARLPALESTLRGLFAVYADRTTNALTITPFVRLLQESELLDESLPAARAEILFKQAWRNSKGAAPSRAKHLRLTPEQFLDAMLLVALDKWPRLPAPEALANLGNFIPRAGLNGKREPLAGAMKRLDPDWFDLVNEILPELLGLYAEYFPLELSPSYAPAELKRLCAEPELRAMRLEELRHEAHRGFHALLHDCSLSRDCDWRATLFAAVRHTLDSDVPRAVHSRLRHKGEPIEACGSLFSLAHFVVALQLLAEMAVPAGRAAKQLLPLLAALEKARWPRGQKKLVPEDLRVQAPPLRQAMQLSLPFGTPGRAPQPEPKPRAQLRALFEWYARLPPALPHSEQLSVRGFQRLCRDAGLVKDDMEVLRAPPRRAQSPGPKRKDATGALTVKHGDNRELPLKIFAPPPLTMTEVDVLFAAAHGAACASLPPQRLDYDGFEAAAFAIAKRLFLGAPDPYTNPGSPRGDPYLYNLLGDQVLTRLLDAHPTAVWRRARELVEPMQEIAKATKDRPAQVLSVTALSAEEKPAVPTAVRPLERKIAGGAAGLPQAPVLPEPTLVVPVGGPSWTP